MNKHILTHKYTDLAKIGLCMPQVLIKPKVIVREHFLHGRAKESQVMRAKGNQPQAQHTLYANQNNKLQHCAKGAISSEHAHLPM